MDTSDFPFTTEGLELMPADELDVVGLSFRVRDSGLGVPLIAVAKQRGEGTAGVGILDETSVAATAFLRLRGGLTDIAGGLPAVLELHSSFDTASVELAGRTVPLESDLIRHGGLRDRERQPLALRPLGALQGQGRGAPERPDPAAPLPARAHPGRARPRHGLESGLLGRADERADRGTR